MNKHYFALTLGALVWTSSASAETFNFDFSEPGTDPATDFDADCLADDLTPEQLDTCDQRAALMEAELLSHLITLEGDDDPESVTLFQQALELDSPPIQAIAVQYLARLDTAPEGFLEQVETFFFGTEPQLGATAANVLSTLADTEDATLGALYNEQRNAADYGPSYYDPENEPLAAACSKDARLNLMASFTSDEQFDPAERLLMYDRFVFTFTDTTLEYPVTAFVTDAALDDVIAHFNEVFGAPPNPPAAESLAELNAITEQIVALQVDALNGDMDAIAKIGKLSEELAVVQAAATLGSRLQLDAIHAGNDVYWVGGGDLDDQLAPLPRAVTAGLDAELDRVVIRYLNGTVEGAELPDGGAPDAPDGGDDEPTDPPDEDDNDNDNDDQDGGAAENKDSGCNVSPAGRNSSWAVGLALVALGLVRRRRG